VSELSALSTLPSFTRRGTGSTAVLLVHGIGGGRSIWSNSSSATLRALTDAGYQAVALDLPGYGGSEHLGLPTLDNMVQAVQDLITHIGAARTIVLGHSMGGMVAQELVARTPQLVQGLVLACTSASFGKNDGAWQAKFLADRLAPLDEGEGMWRMAQRLVPKMVAAATHLAAQQLAVDVMSRVPEATYRAALQAIASFDRREALALIRVPTLVLAAEHDMTAPTDVMQRMASRIVGAQYACVPHAGHIANVESPAAFNECVLRFLEQCFPTL
jgi:3-oxoadipate enol-lactonase